MSYDTTPYAAVAHRRGRGPRVAVRLGIIVGLLMAGLGHIVGTQLDVILTVAVASAVFTSAVMLVGWIVWSMLRWVFS